MIKRDRARYRSIYSKAKRLKRGVLRALGHWSRHGYDVELVIENERPVYKKISFGTLDQAIRVSDNLIRYGPTPHLPTWRDREDNAIWVDFIEGEPCDRVDDVLLPQIAECFGQFASRNSYPLDATAYWHRHLSNLDYLRQNQVVDVPLHRELYCRSVAARPVTLRTGFDYGDPVGPNLLRRDGCGSICAIDVKNLHSDTLVGEGLAKVGDRWLDPERRAVVFAHLNRLGLGDIERSFTFIQLYERAARVKRKVERDLILHRRIRARGAKTKRLTTLLN